MTEEIRQLDDEIKALKKATQTPKKINTAIGGYNVAITIITNLLGSIFVGAALGILLQVLYHTSPLLTAGLTLLGGIAGLYNTARYGLNQERKQNK